MTRAPARALGRSLRTPEPARPAVQRRILIAVGIAGLLYSAIAVMLLMRAQDAFGDVHLIPIMALAFLPVLAFLAVRYPLIFPFGLYLALVPFDSILQLSSGVTITRLAALATAAALITRIVVLRQWSVPGKSFYAWTFFVFYAMVTLFWTPDMPEVGIVTQQVVQLFLIMAILSFYSPGRLEFNGALTCIIASGVGAAAYGIKLYESGSFSASHRLVLGTEGGVAIDPNYFASSFIIPLGFAMSAAFSLRNPWLRVLGALSALAMIGGVLISGSRGGFIAAAIVFGYFIVRSRHKVLASLGGLVALSLTAFFPTVWQRFADDPSSAGSGSGRTFIWHTGLQTLSNHWLFGTGIGSFQNVYDQSLLASGQAVFQGWHRPSHNVLVGTVTEFGIIGLVAMLSAFYLSFRQTRKILRTSDIYWMRAGIESALLGLTVQAFFIDILIIKYYWLAYALPLMIFNRARLLEREQ